MAQHTRTVPAGTPTNVTQKHHKGGIGESTLRPDGTLKVTGEFAYSSDMWHEDMLWGQTLRSTVAHAEIVSIDISEALAMPGVYSVLTYDDLLYRGEELRPGDQGHPGPGRRPGASPR